MQKLVDQAVDWTRLLLALILLSWAVPTAYATRCFTPDLAIAPSVVADSNQRLNEALASARLELAWSVYDQGRIGLFVGNNPINWIDILGLVLSDPQVAGIIFNETRSLSGDAAQLSSLYQNLAHVILNADAMEDASGGNFKRPKSAPTTCKPGPLEQSKYNQILNDVKAARAAVEDPTDGALNFNLRPSNSTGNLFGADYLPLSTQNGPFKNSYTAGGLPANGVYVNTYFDTRYSEP